MSLKVPLEARCSFRLDLELNDLPINLCGH